MYTIYDRETGHPIASYRDPEHIKSDIREISERIAYVNESLNVRELLLEFLEEDKEGNLVERAEALTELLKYATEALDELKNLSDTLDSLKAELSDAMQNIRAF